MGYYKHGDQPKLYDGIDTVHIKSSFDLFDLGHGYVATEDELLADMNQAIRHGATPDDRRLKECTHQGRIYWELGI